MNLIKLIWDLTLMFKFPDFEILSELVGELDGYGAILMALIGTSQIAEDTLNTIGGWFE